LILRKIIKIVATRCQFLRLNAPKSISAGAVPHTPLMELTVLSQTPRSWNKGYHLLKKVDWCRKRGGGEGGKGGGDRWNFGFKNY